MLKLIPIIIITILFYFNTTAQVTIKEEVDLATYIIYTDNIVTAIMPFYGRVHLERTCFGWPGGIFKGELKAGNQMEPFGSYNTNCPASGGCIGSPSTQIFNVTQGSLISIKAWLCGNQWLECELRLTQTANNRYDLEGIDPRPGSNGQWTYIGRLTLIQVTPPGCNPAFDCVEENFLPAIKLVQQPAGYEGMGCQDDCETWALFQLSLNDNGYLYNINDVCFNKQLQGWWFNLDDDHSFIINYVMEFCSTNVICAGKEIIENYTKFPSLYGCENIKKDILAHTSYTQVHVNAHYFLEDIFWEHEKLHKADFIETINENKYILDNQLLSKLRECESFSSKEEAMTYWEEEINEIYTYWRTLVIGLFKDKIHDWPWSDPLKKYMYELDTQNRNIIYVFDVFDNAMELFNCY